MLRKLTLSAALAGIFALAVVFAPGSGTMTLGSAAPDATDISAPVLTTVISDNNNG